MNTLDKRQIIILAAFCLPLFVLIFVSYSGTGSAPAKPPEKRPTVTAQPAAKPAATAVKLVPKDKEIERVKGLLKEANDMSEAQYQERKKTEPTFGAPDVATRRARLARRVQQLERMSPQQWENEQRSGVVLAPSPAGQATAKGVVPSTQTDEKLPPPAEGDAPQTLPAGNLPPLTR
jgi:hypothetical protein